MRVASVHERANLQHRLGDNYMTVELFCVSFVCVDFVCDYEPVEVHISLMLKFKLSSTSNAYGVPMRCVKRKPA